MTPSTSALALDLYQLTTLLCQAHDGDLDLPPVGMGFFFRRMPKARNYVVSAGLRSIVEQCHSLRFSADELSTLQRHPMLGPALSTPAGQRVLADLAALDGFVGDIDALPEGTLAFAGPALDTRRKPIEIAGMPLSAYTPLVQVRTRLLFAKLIETPWLSRLNHLSMVASKTARVVWAATADGIDRPVYELGQRRTHPAAALDAAYAAYLAGCAGSSNLWAHHAFGIPAVGTMDHFAIQAAERPGVSPSETERAFFARFAALFPGAATLLVDTYDTWQGIAAAATLPGGRCRAVRIDSQVTPQTLARARKLLDDLGAPHVRIVVSDGLDEFRVQALAAAGADAFGVGENITCSPDAATGVGAVGKLVLNGHGCLTMKLARGSTKATLPGFLAVYRHSDHDLLTCDDEPAAGGQPLLTPVWRGRTQVGTLPSLQQSRTAVRAQVAQLPAALRDLSPCAPQDAWPLVLSDKLVARITHAAQAALSAPAAHETM